MGDDTLHSGWGNDSFIFNASDGNDTIADARERLIFLGTTTGVTISGNVVSYGSGDTITANGANFNAAIDTSQDYDLDGMMDSIITVT